MSIVMITPIYAALIAILMAILATIASLQRGRLNIALGDGGSPEMLLASRRFGNLSEYAAMVLFMMMLLELRGMNALSLHLFGSTLVALRILHPIVLFSKMDSPMWKKFGRFIAGAGTAVLLIIAAVVLLFF